MGKFREFLERNGKIIEVIFSLISLIIVGVIGTTISINNSITSKASLDLARANAQPAFNINTEYDEQSTTETLTISIESGFAENITVEEYTVFDYFGKANEKDFSKKCIVFNYFEGYHYGNNKGSIARMYKENNFKLYLDLLLGILDIDSKSGLNRFIYVAISYRDITGLDITKYYVNKGGFYFNHVTSDEGNEMINSIKNLPEYDLDKITLNTLITLPDTL
ncbi:MAG: hypothetical protein IKP77_06555 [Acholeplasmatales bacterium]|nr:hypothetical protein [Acholeplasmatales bacterium]